MNRNQVDGRYMLAKGKLQVLAGKALGNYPLQADGHAWQTQGRMQLAFGNAKQATRARIRELLHRIQVQS